VEEGEVQLKAQPKIFQVKMAEPVEEVQLM
jgi:hypothetical protein